MKKVMVLEPSRLAILDVEVPAVGPGQVKLRTRRSGLSSRSELERYLRNYAGKPEEIGYNIVGDVVEVAPDVTTLKVGDRAYVGIGHAEFAVADAARVVPLPDGVDDESGCFAYLPTLGTHALRLADYQPGEVVAVNGQGIIGQTARLVAQLYGARAIAIDISDDRLELARRGGAHLTINPRREDARAAIDAFTGGQGVDVLIDTASNWKALAQCFDLMRYHGRVVFIGMLRDPMIDTDATSFFEAWRRNMHSKELTLRGASNDAQHADPSREIRFTYQRNMVELLQHVASGALNLRQLITHRYPIDEIEAVYKMLGAGRTEHLGVVFTWPR